jgi:hypothetical protein
MAALGLRMAQVFPHLDYILSIGGIYFIDHEDIAAMAFVSPG